MCASTGARRTNDKFFGRYSFATYNDRRDKQPFPLVLPTRNDQPFRNVGGQLESRVRPAAP